MTNQGLINWSTATMRAGDSTQAQTSVAFITKQRGMAMDSEQLIAFCREHGAKNIDGMRLLGQPIASYSPEALAWFISYQQRQIDDATRERLSLRPAARLAAESRRVPTVRGIDHPSPKK